MGRDTYYSHEEEYNQYKNRQAMRGQSILPFRIWVYKHLRYQYIKDSESEIEERVKEAIERHKEILNTVETGRF